MRATLQTPLGFVQSAFGLSSPWLHRHSVELVNYIATLCKTQWGQMEWKLFRKVRAILGATVLSAIHNIEPGGWNQCRLGGLGHWLLPCSGGPKLPTWGCTWSVTSHTIYWKHTVWGIWFQYKILHLWCLIQCMLIINELHSETENDVEWIIIIIWHCL